MMSHKLHLALTVIELTNWDMQAFLITSSLSDFILSETVTSVGPFSVVVENIPITLSMGVESEDDGEPKAYTRLHFDYHIDADLALLSLKPSPTLIHGDGASSTRAVGDIGMVKYNGDIDTAKLYSHEDTVLLDAQEAQSTSIATQVRTLLPFVSEAINQVREAIRIELFPDAIQWDFLVHSLLAGQHHRRWQEAQLAPDLDDAAFLFAAFPGRGAPRLTQETNIRFTISNDAGQSHSGVLINARSGRSPERLASLLPSIQARLANGWSVRDSALLSAIEHLYADSYRLAVFNAAAYFEAQVLSFYETLIQAANREATLLERRLHEYKKENKGGHTLAVFQAILPRFLSQEVISSGALQRSLDAWIIRNEAIAHLHTPQSERRFSRDDAWGMVVSIYQVIDSLPKP